MLTCLIGLRNAIFSGFATQDYAELSHFDLTDNGATLGLRCCNSIVERPYSYSFILLTIMYEGQMGVIVEQSIGTMTAWMGGRCEHTSSVDPIEFGDGMKPVLEPLALSRVPSVGLIAVQQKKMLSVAFKRRLETGKVVYFPAFE